MELTEKELARAVRAAERIKRAQWAAKKEAKWERELVERAKKKYPEQFAEFTRLKKLKAKYQSNKWDDKLHWLQMEMVYGLDWVWDGLDANLVPEFTKAENATINAVAGRYFESVEMRQ